MTPLLTVLFFSPALTASAAGEDLPDPTVELHWVEGETGLRVIEPPGWSVPRKTWTQLDVRWPSDQRTFAVNRRYLTRKGFPVPFGDERVHVQTEVKICRKDLCRTAELSVSGQADLTLDWGRLTLQPGEWEPPEPPSLDAPDPTGESQAVARAIADARAAGRIPLLYFWMDGCPPCDQLKAGLDGRAPEVFSERYTLIPVDLGKRHLRRWGVAYGSRGTPTLVAVGPDDEVIDRHVGFGGMKAVGRFLEAAAR